MRPIGWLQVAAFGLLDERDAEAEDSPLQAALRAMYGRMGDRLARQYAGTDAHRKDLGLSVCPVRG